MRKESMAVRSSFFAAAVYGMTDEEELDRVPVERCLQGDIDAFGTLSERCAGNLSAGLHEGV